CGRSLGDRADDYATALSADDTAAVAEALELGPLDLYGDSYGTFFQQVFAGRHPDLVRSIVLDGAYPTYGESGWYPTQGPTMRNAFTVVCERSPACRNAGATWGVTIRRVLDRVREEPWRGTAYDADGRRARVVVDAEALAAVAYAATYGPAFYRELTAALRSALRGDRAPLLRLVAEALGGGTDAGNPRAYSEGLDAAVACHDYPQVYPMTLRPGVHRASRYAAELLLRRDRHPRTYAPFTVLEYAGSDWQMLDWCLRWPTAPADNPAGPVRPPGGSYPDVPVLVLSGELDSITTPAEGALIVEQFPDATQVVVPNSFHVTALGDTDGCASALVRRFVRDPDEEPGTCD
ncbi:MAG: alpha/beta hydrolase, partial [Actinomycetales bacterium]